MELVCGGKEGGWMRIAHIDNGQNCPMKWQQITSPVRACRFNSFNPGCVSNLFTNNGVRYNNICGKVVGYQKGTPDGFYVGKSIDEIYADGILLTYGTPRKHIWSYVNGLSSNDNTCVSCNCPCAKYPGIGPPSFVQNHFYCDSGNPSSNLNAGKYYTTNVLWDGEGCAGGDNCCSQAGMPWFYRQLPVQINAAIEARICRDQHDYDEDVLVRDLEIFVQ